jgi:3-oxoacyl-ACP reductase-like protein
MSIFGNIMSAIFGHSSSAAAAAPASAPAAATPASPAAPSASAQAPAAAQPAAPAAPVDVTGIMDNLAGRSSERLDWRKSIVDLMKLLNLDSSLAARKELAQELSYGGDMNDSASMNIWLHKQVMTKLAQNGGKVPDELRV